MDDRPLAGQAALVTGGGVRLGRAIALRLGAAGAHVVVHHHASGKQAKAVCKEIQAADGQAVALSADLSDPDAAANLVERAAAAAGAPLRILVNNASDFPASTLGDLTWDGLAESLRLDAWAPFELSRQFARQLPDGASATPKRQAKLRKAPSAPAAPASGPAGSIVNILDARIADYDWEHAGYHLAKRMLADLTRLMAVQLAPGVTVNGVAPGPVLPPPGKGEDILQKWAKHLPLRRTPSPEDVADACLFLLRSPSTTGQVLFVDGGRHLGKAVYA